MYYAQCPACEQAVTPTITTNKGGKVASVSCSGCDNPHVWDLKPAALKVIQEVVDDGAAEGQVVVQSGAKAAKTAPDPKDGAGAEGREVTGSEGLDTRTDGQEGNPNPDNKEPTDPPVQEPAKE